MPDFTDDVNISKKFIEDITKIDKDNIKISNKSIENFPNVGKILIDEHKNTLDGTINTIDWGSIHIDDNKPGLGGADLSKADTGSIHIDGYKPELVVGNVVIGNTGIRVINTLDKGSIHINGNKPEIVVGNVVIGNTGIGLIQSKSRYYTIGLDAEKSTIALADPQKGNYTVLIDGTAGDITLWNADCAEDFEISQAEQVDPGTVMVLNDEGKLVQGKQPYDKRVAGVTSGAGDLKPGLILGRQVGHKDRVPLALMGRVYCKVDADYGSVEVGDLLTTSETSGHAMKASDPTKSFGAVIGKALKSLETGRGLIPILVALQ